MGDDYEDEAGLQRRVGVNAYEVVQDNLTAILPPTTDDDSDEGYSLGSPWVDTVEKKIYFCADATPGLAVWKEAGGSGGGGSGEPSNGDKGDVIVSASGLVWTIDAGVVTYAKIQDVSATDKLLGRSSSGAGDVEEIACTAAARALLDDPDFATMRSTLGLGSLATLSAIGSAQITDGSVANADLVSVATQTLKGRTTAGTGAPEDLTAAQARTLLNVEDGATANPTAFEAAVSGEIVALTEKTTPDSADMLLIEDSAASNVKKKVRVGNLPTGGGGEVNTGSNAGAGGVGVFSGKVGVDLQFRNINAGSSKISVSLDGANKEVDLDVVEANVLLQNLGGAVTDGQIPASIARDSEVTAAITTHEAASDPHTGYQKETEKAAANGYAGLDSNAKVTLATVQNIATARILGRTTAGSGVIEELTGAQAASIEGAELTANKDIASGYAGLDARVQVPVARQRPRLWDVHMSSMSATRSVPGYKSEGFGTLLVQNGLISTIADANGVWTRHTTAGSNSGEVAGLEGPHYVFVQSRWTPELTVVMRTGSSLANCIYWIGFWSGGINTLTAPAGKSIAALRFVQGSDTGWTTYTCDGTASTNVVLNPNYGGSPLTVATNTIYELRISVVSGAVQFWVNGAKSATDHSTFLPASDTWMTPGNLLTTGSAVARYQDIQRLVLEHS